MPEELVAGQRFEAVCRALGFEPEDTRKLIIVRIKKGAGGIL